MQHDFTTRSERAAVASCDPAGPLPRALAIGGMLFLAGCFPGATEQGQGSGQGVIIADIAEEATEE